MKNTWTVETAKQALKGAKKGEMSLRQCGAFDFLRSKNYIGQTGMGSDDESDEK